MRYFRLLFLVLIMAGVLTSCETKPGQRMLDTYVQYPLQENPCLRNKNRIQ